MIKEEMATRLNGRTYGSEATGADISDARKAGLVIVFGASDDLMEFEGAICDEVGCGKRTVVYVDAHGVLDISQIDDDADEAIADYVTRKAKARTITALWAAEPGYSWTYETDIPHACFEVVEDGEPYCRGIVFDLASLRGEP